MSLRRTKIVATIGPASSSPEVLEQLILAGMDVARLNFSHGNADEHRARAVLIREIAARLNCHVALLGDLQRPKIRIEIGRASCRERVKISVVGRRETDETVS